MNAATRASSGRPGITRFSRRAMLCLSLLLLLAQVLVPWGSRDFTTQDGPSHVYTSHVAFRLLAPNSPYAGIYSFRGGFPSNWGTLLVMKAATTVAGRRYAEQAFVTLTLCLSFAGLIYLGRSVGVPCPAAPWLNFLLNTWFLWIGFYNFALAAGLSFFCVAFQIRFLRTRQKSYLIIAAFAGIVVFFTHALVAAVSVATTAVVAGWVLAWRFVRVRSNASAVRRLLRDGALTLLSLTPVMAMLAHFLVNSTGGIKPFEWVVFQWALQEFPMHMFASGRGRIPEQALLWPAVLAVSLSGVLSFTKHEARRFSGALAAVGMMMFVGYLVVPNEAFGGEQIKMRLGWFCFAFLVIAMAGARSLQRMLSPMGLLVSLLVTAALAVTLRNNVRHAGAAAAEYERVLDHVSAGSTLVRMNYTSERTRRKFDYDAAALEPLLHLEAKAAARRDFVDLSDYQALAGIFPITLAAQFGDQHRHDLWALENYGNEGTEALWRLLADFPVAIDYVVVVGDETQRDRQAVLEELGRRADLVATDKENSFVWLFRRRGASWNSSGKQP